jgi:hypothetical protein
VPTLLTIESKLWTATMHIHDISIYICVPLLRECAFRQLISLPICGFHSSYCICRVSVQYELKPHQFCTRLFYRINTHVCMHLAVENWKIKKLCIIKGDTCISLITVPILWKNLLHAFLNDIACDNVFVNYCLPSRQIETILDRLTSFKLVVVSVFWREQPRFRSIALNERVHSMPGRSARPDYALICRVDISSVKATQLWHMVLGNTGVQNIFVEGIIICY